MPEISMPRLSDTMQEGTITRWLKQPGDEIKKGDVVAEVETDKANMEIEAFSSGILEQILVKEGEVAPIGQPIAILGTGAGVQTQSKAKAPEAKAAPTQVVSNVANAEPHISARAQNGEAIKSSPLARRMAEEHGIDLTQIKGSGPAGRIVRDDIEDYLEQQRLATPISNGSTASSNGTAPVLPQTTPPTAVTADADVVTLSTMQKTIARRLTESKQNVPHFYVSNEVDLTDALEIRQKLNANLGAGDVKISVNDLIVKACALALEKFPEVNGSYKDGQFILPKHINVGIAVDVPAGLFVPVIRDANLKGLRTIAKESKALGAKAQAGKLTPTDLEGGTFSISNLGMMDVTEFSAVINPPQSAILAVGASRKIYVPIDNQPVVRDIMRVTLSADHRILYGATVARFLQEVKRLLQNVYLILG
jgi:pyruvate dehydrogenase E2 component (dihydrolipoamide acetyltransferase)